MIVSFEQLPNIREKHRQERVVFRSGCYDLVHEGHIEGLNFAKLQGDILVVGVRPDERVRERKGPARPIRGEIARLALIDALRVVDYAFIMPPGNDEHGPATMRVIHTLQPHVFVAGNAHPGGHPNDEKIRSLGTEVVFDMCIQPESTSGIIDRILDRYSNQDI